MSRPGVLSFGPSGCGKTTPRSIVGFEQPDSGDILLDGRSLSLPPEQRLAHTVFQSYALFPHMTVADNIAFCGWLAATRPRFASALPKCWRMHVCPTPAAASRRPLAASANGLR